MSSELSEYLSTGTKLPALDGLRGWAITLVLFFHCALYGPVFIHPFLTFSGNFGWSGVDLFFVLSGFLITNILLTTRNNPAYFKHFYMRRILRIFPLYYAFLLFSFLYYQEFHGFFYHIFYASNFYLVFAENIASPTPASLTWSLAIEEQFYLMWPLLIFFFNNKKLIFINISIIIGAFLLRHFLFLTGTDFSQLYFLTYTRIDTLSFGALIALLLQSHPNTLPILRKWAKFLILLVPFGIYYIWSRTGFFVFTMSPGTTTTGLSLLALFYTSILILAISSPSRLITILFKNKPLLLIGKHSYCMYLIHTEVIFFLREIYANSFLLDLSLKFPRIYTTILFNTAAFAVTLLVSIIIWHVFEKHFIRLKDKFTYK